ncbi:MAG TPA: hypothetical protein PKY25_01780 [Bacilli bacterium]|nr:hypothetical protein [Bacilli bacterium]
MNKEINIDSYIEKINSSRSKEERIKNIYNYVCDYLDTNYNYLCDFKDGKCIANRLGLSVHEKDGCCYKLGEGLCKYQINNMCTNKNPSCKFFFCGYLEKKYKIKIKIPYIKKLLNRKQVNIIKRSYFYLKKDLINKLVEYDRRKYEKK